MTARFLFLLASARRDGNTEALARLAADSVRGDISQEWIRFSDLKMPAAIDRRHRAGALHECSDQTEQTLLEATLRASDIVIASPIYWYNLSASAKLYLDYWSSWTRLPGVDFKARMNGKTLWGIAAMSEDNPDHAAPMVQCLELTAAYMRMKWGGVLLGLGNGPGEINTDVKASLRAQLFLRTS